MHLDPLHQFRIKELFNINILGKQISVNNSMLTMVITTLSAIILLFLGTRKMKDKNISKIQSLIEIMFNIVVKAFESSIGHKVDDKFRPYSKYVITLFFMILFLNLQSMIPGSFAATGQFAVTLAAGATVTIATIILMVQKHGIAFLKSFIPEGTPGFMAPIIFTIELISFFIRPVSLCIRLGANIIAGHIMLEVLAAIAVSGGILYGPFAFILMLSINIMELGIVCLQAYIFASLTSVYIGQAAHH